MAQALRAVWLEPEEQQEPLAPQLSPRQRRRPVAANRQSPLALLRMIGMVAIAVVLVAGYIASNARIARYQFREQALRGQLHQLQDDCGQLSLDVARLENTPRITQVALAQQLEFPSADRVHYVRVAASVAQPPTVASIPQAQQRSWFARTSRQIDVVYQRLSRGPGSPAYAQE